MDRTIITLLDNEPIDGWNGRTLITGPFRIPPGFGHAEWYICGWHFAGRSVLRVIGEEQCAPNTWNVFDHFDLYDDVILTHVITTKVPDVVRAQITYDEDPYVKRSESAERLRLTVKLILWQELGE